MSDSKLDCHNRSFSSWDKIQWASAQNITYQKQIPFFFPLDFFFWDYFGCFKTQNWLFYTAILSTNEETQNQSFMALYTEAMTKSLLKMRIIFDGLDQIYCILELSISWSSVHMALHVLYFPMKSFCKVLYTNWNMI